MIVICLWLLFQHTAARRRLVDIDAAELCQQHVSTHSRPKAAGYVPSDTAPHNTQFQHTAARRRLVRLQQKLKLVIWFQHTAARRRLGHDSC